MIHQNCIKKLLSKYKDERRSSVLRSHRVPGLNMSHLENDIISDL